MRTFSTLVFSFLLTFIAGCALDNAAGTSGALGESHPYFELSEQTGEHYFALNAVDGSPILHSEGYATRTNALAGMLAVIDNGIYPALYRVVDLPDGTAQVVLRAANNEVIGESDPFATHAEAQAAIPVAVAAVDAYQGWLAERTGRRFDVFRGADGRFYFNLHAGNGEIVLRSQGYTTEASAYSGVLSVVAHGVSAERYSVRQAVNGQWYFNLLAANGQVIGTSELYVSRYNAERARDGVIALIPTVEVF